MIAESDATPVLDPSSFRFAVRKVLLHAEKLRLYDRANIDPDSGEIPELAYCPGEIRCAKFHVEPNRACHGCRERRFKVFAESSITQWERILDHCFWLDAKFQCGYRPSNLDALKPMEWEMREILLQERNWLDAEIRKRFQDERE